MFEFLDLTFRIRYGLVFFFCLLSVVCVFVCVPVQHPVNTE